jgi:hypothetical protein
VFAQNLSAVTASNGQHPGTATWIFPSGLNAMGVASASELFIGSASSSILPTANGFASAEFPPYRPELVDASLGGKQW